MGFQRPQFVEILLCAKFRMVDDGKLEKAQTVVKQQRSARFLRMLVHIFTTGLKTPSGDQNPSKREKYAVSGRHYKFHFQQISRPRIEMSAPSLADR